MKERGLGAVSDTGALEAFVDQAIAANPGPVADFKAGKKAAAGFFVGQVMKLSKGKADPKIVGGLVAKKLASLCTSSLFPLPSSLLQRQSCCYKAARATRSSSGTSSPMMTVMSLSLITDGANRSIAIPLSLL